MIRSFWIVPVVLVSLAIGAGVAALAIDGDWDRGERVVQITAPATDSGEQPQVVTIDEGDHWRGGFFPFGFLFPLLWIGLIIFVVSFFWRGRGGGRWSERFEDWHRRQHESTNGQPPASGASSS